MTNYERQQWIKSTVSMAALREHVRKALEDPRPVTEWFAEWKDEAERLFDRQRWWDPKHVMEWAHMAVARRSQLDKEAA